MRLITLLDTSIATDNLGDEIIMHAVRSELREFLPHAYSYVVPTHDTLGRQSRKMLRKSEFGIVGGTNIMSSQIFRGANWKIMPQDLLSMHDIVLMGVGWMDYLPNPTRYARFVYDRILSSKFAHSCRDEYTTKRLRQLDQKALNTACPTMWKLSESHCRSIPTHKAEAVVTALTFYRSDPANDIATLKLLKENYTEIYFWPQQQEDLAYARTLGDFGLIPIDPNVDAYNHLLETRELDFVGSRLHGGIRALQYGRRALITIVDNRAREIGRDTGLPVVERDKLDEIARWINDGPPTEVILPTAEIEEWKSQFGAG